jgi:23S rRNA pseudouridine2605 synthase
VSETRLNAYLAHSGVTSRRGADKLIASGSVRVNGRVPPPDGVMVDPDRDRVTVDGRTVKPTTQYRYVMLNKPVGVITTAKDEAGRTSVLDVLGDGASGHRVYPVGRLDVDSTGLLLITDDGDVAYRLTHPRYKVAKEYVAIVGGSPSRDDLERLRAGVELDDGVTAPAEVDVLRVLPGPAAEMRLVIREGLHRQVRRMLMAVGHRVLALNRTTYGPLRLGRLKPGNWRVLSDGEVAALRTAAGLQ